MRDWVTLGSYQYDPFGRRVKKVTSAGAVYFHYDDTGLLADYDASGQLISEYQYQPGNHWMTHPLFKRDGATGKVHYYYNSHLGQPLKLFDKAGRTTWSARSQAFGETDVVLNETDNPLRFPGQYEDGETGLYYNYHRYYDAETGRYLRSDPIGLAGGVNAYAYVGGNPIHYMDVLGLCRCDLPDSKQFMDNYPGYYDYEAGDVWELIGGNLNEAYGKDSRDGPADSCAARGSYGLNKSGAQIPSGPDANRVWGGENDGERYIISARGLNNYLRSKYGPPDRSLESQWDLAKLWWDLEDGAVAFVSSTHHFGVFGTTYSDRYLVGRLGDVWILPTEECSCRN